MPLFQRNSTINGERPLRAKIARGIPSAPPFNCAGCFRKGGLTHFDLLQPISTLSGNGRGFRSGISLADVFCRASPRIPVLRSRNEPHHQERGGRNHDGG